MRCIPPIFAFMRDSADTRRRMAAALAVRSYGEGANRLLDYVSERERRELAPLMEACSADPEGPEAMDRLISQMLASERFSSIAEVHPAWILEHLKGEPPRIVGLILRSLPSSHVRYLLKNLPPMLRDCVPNMVESFAVRPEVLELIRRRFEANFLPMRVTRSIAHPGLEHLYFLKVEELGELIRELGLLEMAIALSGMSSKALHMIFNRLDLKDAKRLQARIKGLRGISPELHRQARFNLLEIEGRHEGSDRMLASVGLAALASAVGRDLADLARLIQQKMAPSDGYLLKRFIDERRQTSIPKVAQERRGMVLRLVARLASEGRIDPQWRSFAPDYVPEEEPDASRSWEDETISMKVE